MKTCRVCQKEKIDFPVIGGYALRYCRECYNAQRRASHGRVKESVNAKRRQDYADNANGYRDRCHLAAAKRYAEIGAMVREWEAALPIEKRRELGRNKQARYRESLTDCYVRRLMTHPDRTTLRDVPKSLVDAKRELLRIERYLNEKR